MNEHLAVDLGRVDDFLRRNVWSMIRRYAGEFGV
jgi:hypothetical protein